MGLEGCSWLVNSVYFISNLHQHLKWELTLTKLSIFSPMQMARLLEFILLVEEFW